MSILDQIKQLEEQLEDLEQGYGCVEKLKDDLVSIKEKREQAFAYTGVQEPDTDITISVDSHGLSFEIPSEVLLQLVVKYTDTTPLLEVKNKLKKIQEVLNESA